MDNYIKEGLRKLLTKRSDLVNSEKATSCLKRFCLFNQILGANGLLITKAHTSSKEAFLVVLLSYPKICPPISQDIPYIHAQGFLKSLSDKLPPRQSTQTRVWHFSDQDGLPTSPRVFMPPHMLQRLSMSSFKPYKSSFLRQLLRWLKINCIRQKVNCGQHTATLHNFWSTSSF